MSVHIAGAVWDSKLPRDMKLIALANADYADHDGENVFPGRKLVARMTGYSRRSVEIITRQLVQAGIFVEDGISQHQTKRYKFNMKALADFRPPGYVESGGAETSGGAKKAVKGGEEKRTRGGEETTGEPLERKKPSGTVNGNLFGEEAVLIGRPRPMQEITFREEWDNFKLHRKKMGCPMTARAEELILATLAERPEQSVEALRLAMTKGWKTVEWEWFDKAKRTGNGSGAKLRRDITEENAL